jgi:hypothetical protein
METNMRNKLFSLLIAAAIAVATSAAAFAQVGVGFPGPGTPHTTGGGAATFTPGASVPVQNIAFAGGSQSFTGLNGGVNFPAGAVVIVGVGTNTASTTLITPAIGGNAATIVTGSQDTNANCTFYQATMSASSPDTFTFNNPFSIAVMGVGAGYFQNLVSSTRDAVGVSNFGVSTTTVSLSTSPSVSSGGFGVIFTFYSEASNAPPTSYIWTNTTLSAGDEFARIVTPNSSVGFAHTTSAGAWSPTAALTGGGAGFASCASAVTYH